jgi:subtilase family serine protease
MTTSAVITTLRPTDLATIHDIKPLYAAGTDGTGQMIAIAGETDVDLSDIRAFRQRFNLPPNDPQIVTYGKDPGPVAAQQAEANLDLEWSGAVAPGARIIFVNSTNAFTSAQYAIDQDLAPVLSIRYGFCEAGLESVAPALRTVAQQANARALRG